jgi:arylsulfatase A-like enzyme
VPAKYRRLYSLDKLKDRPNFLTPYTRDRKKMKKFAEEFPIETHRKRSTIYRGVIPDIVREELLGYYAHITALDEYVGRILRTLRQCGLDQDTIFLFTSDHGDMLGSHRKFAKQWPYDESVRVPFLLRYPKKIKKGRRVTNPIGTVDVMPTLLGLAGLDIPGTVEGSDLSHAAIGPRKPSDSDAALTMCISPFVSHPSWGMREYRGIRTARYTYARTLEGPWLLFDNQKDPYQLKNLVRRPEHSALQRKLDIILSRNLRKINDSFEPAEVYRERAGIHVVKDDNAIPVRKTE